MLQGLGMVCFQQFVHTAQTAGLFGHVQLQDAACNIRKGFKLPVVAGLISFISRCCNKVK
jgi:hypothetical protein